MVGNRRKTGGESAFTLVEIAMSLGLVAFVLMSLLGLLGVGLDQGKSAQIDTALSQMVQSVITDTRSRVFSSLGGTYTADYDGNLLTGANTSDANTTSTNAAYFQCTVTASVPGSEVATAAQANLQRLKLEFVYPLSVPSAKRTTTLIYASLAQQD